MNKKGFTLVELIAVIIIIAIISTVGIISISSTTQGSRKSAFVDLGKNYAESARTMRAEDRLPHDPRDGEAVIIKAEALDGVEIENKDESGFGDLIYDSSYIAIVNDNHNYKYYIFLLDDTDHAIAGAEYSVIDEDDVLSGASTKVLRFANLAKDTVIKINNTSYVVTNTHSTYVVLKKQ